MIDKGSFFKSHKDTPRSDSMFGSLVIVFPIAHEGGALHLSSTSNWQSSSIDFCQILKNAPANSIAFAAFYGDVDHEVEEVTSGYRVSLTFNLYYDDEADRVTHFNEIVHTPTNTSYGKAYHRLQETLSRLLRNLEFLKNGGILGFKLQYQYPIPTGAKKDYQDAPRSVSVGGNPLESLKKYLKGSDAVIHNVCADLGLTTVLKFVYEDEDPRHPSSCKGIYLLSDFALHNTDASEQERVDVYKRMAESCVRVI